MTPRVWMNKLNGQIVIAWPWEEFFLSIDGPVLVGWSLEDDNGYRWQYVGVDQSEQFYDIGEW